MAPLWKTRFRKPGSPLQEELLAIEEERRADALAEERRVRQRAGVGEVGVVLAWTVFGLMVTLVLTAVEMVKVLFA